MYFWVTFKDRTPGCVQSDGKYDSQYYGENWRETRPIVVADARARAEKFGEVATIEVIPYPANPRLDVRDSCPSFCWNPQGCQGRTSCPRPRACDD